MLEGRVKKDFNDRENNLKNIKKDKNLKRNIKDIKN